MNSRTCQNCGLLFQSLAPVCERCSYSNADNQSRQIDEELRRINRVGMVEHPRLLAAIWFACAACATGLIVLWYLVGREEPTGYQMALILVGLPSVIAGLYGALLGRGILDQYDVNTGAQSFLRGALIAFLTFLTFIPSGYLIVMMIAESSFGNFAVLFKFFIAVMVYGFILVGWWGVLLGGLAGWLLYKLHR